MVQTPEDTEIVAAEWMRYWGFEDAKRTPTGPDGGTDVRSARAVAQVKAYLKPVGRPDVQNLYGVAAAEGKLPLFFALGGYTPLALEWGTSVGIGMFSFNFQGVPEPANAVARGVVEARPRADDPRAGNSTAESLAPAAFPLNCLDATAAALISSQRKGRLSGREHVEWVIQLGLPIHPVTIGYSVVVGSFRKRSEHRSVRVLYEGISGRPITLPSSRKSPTSSPTRAASHIVAGLVNADEVVRATQRLWDKYCTLTQGAALTRYRTELQALGVPQSARTISLASEATIFLPVFVGSLRGGSGRRAVVVEGSTGTVSAQLGSIITTHLAQMHGQLMASGRRVAS